jgi:class 3 adenylate cyclase/ABC-type lipoprotein export system ATPase subunit
MSDFTLWLQNLGIEKYSAVLASHDIDLTVVPDLTEQDLEKLGLSLGHRRKFLTAAAKFRPEAASSPVASAQAQPSSQSSPVAERRQVTVVFIDLVGSTALGSELDPEDLIRLLREYREACVAAVGKYDGYIAQYLGDGILVYFGFPLALEHAAELAVRAGLETVEKVGRLKRPDGLPLQCRVGIATGLVVTGGASGVGAAGEETVVGDTPNLAARLQSAAEPDCVLVGPSTHQLTGDFFDYSFLGEQAIKGFSAPVLVWKALRESATESRFAAAHAAAAGPMVGRERELAFLYDSWQRATQGDGHVVLLAGEAGMGKSRLLEALVERVREEPHRLLRCQCSPYHRNSALFPLKTLLRHRLDIGRDLSIQENMDRIRRGLERVGRDSRSSMLLLAELLEIPVEETLSPIEMAPNQRKNETLAIVEDLLMMALDGPVLLLLEDAHWSDQTTQTLIDRLLKRIGRERVLVLITHRPELKTNWSEHAQGTQINCKPIGQGHCAALIRQVANRTQIDEALVQEIVARSDGVPLFAQELTRAVMDLRSVGPGAVPLTLQDSLMARLDRLGRAKDVAQVASVFGRQFSFALLEAVAGASESDLRAALVRLRESGLIFEAGNEDGLSYSFNHSLVQEAAYESLSRSRRQSLHDEIARHLEFRSAATGESEPTLIAHHYSRAGDGEKSFEFWLLAADRSSQRLAFAESVANLTSALAEAERVNDPARRTELKLEAQLRLGVALVMHKGPQSSEAELALEEARTLATMANAGPQLFQATWGLYINAARNQRLDKAELRGDELMTISRQIGDEDLQFEALHHRWGFVYFKGQTEEMFRCSAAGIEQYDRDRHHKFSYVYAGHDPGTCAYCVRALALGLAGRARSVRPALDDGLALANSLQHPLTLAFFNSVACFGLHMVGDAGGCREFAERVVQVSSRYDFPATRAVGSFMLGAARALEGDIAPALEQMEPSFEATFGYGFLGMLPGVIMTETLAGANRDGEALALVTRLIEGSGTPEEGVFVPELWRLRGELMLRRSAGDAREAERYFGIAAGLAARQGAVVYQWRAGTRLSRLLAEQGRREEARAVLDRASVNPLDEWQGPEIGIGAQLRSQLGTN